MVVGVVTRTLRDVWSGEEEEGHHGGGVAWEEGPHALAAAVRGAVAHGAPVAGGVLGAQQP